jgi:hypothetical protein
MFTFILNYIHEEISEEEDALKVFNYHFISSYGVFFQKEDGEQSEEAKGVSVPHLSLSL